MNDGDNSSLGRGLESLIPKSGGRNPADPPQADKTAEAGFSPPDKSGRQPSEPKPAEPAPVRTEPVSPPKAEEAARVFSKESSPHRRQAPEAIFHIEVDKIKPNPDQPRREFPEEGIRELAVSIREFGLLQPIVVRKIEREVPTGTEVEYELISGERRLLAAKMLGMELIPAIIRKVEPGRERLEMAIIENIQRENLNPVEVARALARLQDEFRMTQREIAVRLGKSREAVANTMRLLDLPPYILGALEKNQITESHGRLLLTVAEPALQEKLFRDLLERHLTTRELKSRMRAVKPAPRSEGESDLPPELKMLQEKLSSELGAPVEIKRHGESGRITISFYSEEELKNIVDRLASEE
jgi:ParB family chromosome partitioning protein